MEVFLDLYEHVFKDKYIKDKAVKTFGILYSYALDDIEKELFTADEFGRAIQMSGKYYKFVPTYPELKESIMMLRDEDKYKPKPYEHLQLGDGEVTPPEQAKEKLKEIKRMINNAGIGG